MNKDMLAVLDRKAWCVAYATEPGLPQGLIHAEFVATAKSEAASLVTRLRAGAQIWLEDDKFLTKQTEVVIPLAISDQAQDAATKYTAAYACSPPHKLPTGVGYHICIRHRDADMWDVRPRHYAYVLRFPQDTDEAFQARFLWLWGKVTCLPYLTEETPDPFENRWPGSPWFSLLWTLGARLGLITELQAFNCQGWRIDPREELPQINTGWRHVLQMVVQLTNDQARSA